MTSFVSVSRLLMEMTEVCRFLTLLEGSVPTFDVIRGISAFGTMIQTGHHIVGRLSQFSEYCRHFLEENDGIPQYGV